ncbi:MULTISPECIES: hypothetical protein [unclassified Bacillus (in: firmicutes)]|uniref:hypothetical protein n=1 Tax=unclassified Bacillus (in: firmicutes) TaxID=185979 RepID=UPI0008E33B8E|nr:MULTISPECIES: hypothetical protein [unclassified Bacillus (in: firmicutes)]SFK05085.1 hypothetical protein SAMN04488574_14713 [Bacillus sp. 71mf]SFT22646.1 hypothetical protein SAMN04488145_12517 [Bacillus sp. 103mf]
MVEPKMDTAVFAVQTWVYDKCHKVKGLLNFTTKAIFHLPSSIGLSLCTRLRKKSFQIEC